MTFEPDIKIPAKLQLRLRWSAWLIASGLASAALSLWMKIPLALLISMGMACALAGLGMLFYLYSIVSVER